MDNQLLRHENHTKTVKCDNQRITCYPYSLGMRNCARFATSVQHLTHRIISADATYGRNAAAKRPAVYCDRSALSRARVVNVLRAGGGVIMKHSWLWLDDERLFIIPRFVNIFETKYRYTSATLVLGSRL